MTREFIIDMQVSGKYDEAAYELETVEEVHVDAINSFAIYKKQGE